MEIKFLNRQIEKFIRKQSPSVVAKILRTLDLLEKYGNKLGMPHSKNIDRNIFELRIRGKREIRITYCFHKGVVVLLYIFEKKSQKVPRRMIEISKKALNMIE